jgi:hypothetical protein
MRLIALAFVATACSASTPVRDAGVTDAGDVDSGQIDSGTQDAGAGDAGQSDSGVPVEKPPCSLDPPPLDGGTCSPRPACTRDAQVDPISYAAFQGTCDAGEVCLPGVSTGNFCAPAVFEVDLLTDGGRSAPNAEGFCEACGRCFFRCGDFFGETVCPQTCVQRFNASDCEGADYPDLCVVSL